MGSVSAVRIMNSAIPRFSVFVAESKVSHNHHHQEAILLTFVGTLLELLVRRRLLNQVKNLFGTHLTRGHNWE